METGIASKLRNFLFLSNPKWLTEWTNNQKSFTDGRLVQKNDMNFFIFITLSFETYDGTDTTD